MNHDTRSLDSAWWALRIGLGVGPFLAGLDKFFNLLTDWTMYLSPAFARLLPVSPEVFMRSVGVIEMIVGLAILTRWTRLGAYVACGWLLAIALNLLTTGNFFDIAVRDVEIALGAFTLARLTAWREARMRTGAAPETMPGRRHVSAA
ncbi:MAG TPA: DoxX family membrane protein [Candidatus Polarisedimenticolia bacterium]|nr:DoxX family membrane protein [Candidatus Polarisedimenticolia bacterium]